MKDTNSSFSSYYLVRFPRNALTVILGNLFMLSVWHFFIPRQVSSPWKSTGIAIIRNHHFITISLFVGMFNAQSCLSQVLGRSAKSSHSHHDDKHIRIPDYLGFLQKLVGSFVLTNETCFSRHYSAVCAQEPLALIIRIGVSTMVWIPSARSHKYFKVLVSSAYTYLTL